MARDGGHVVLKVDGRAARLVLDRPPLHILTLEVLRDLTAACERLARTPEVAVVVVVSTGSRAFCAGVDVAEHTPDRAGPMLEAFEAFAERMLELEPVLIAAVQGPALGGGWELALLCDFVVAAEGATFGVPEITLAALPPVAAAVLPRRVGDARALRLVLMGESLPAPQAHQWGLVHQVVPPQDLEEATERLAGRFLGMSGVALRLAKRAVLGPSRQEVREALRQATGVYRERLLSTADAAEGIAAFLEKRAPVWRHA